eukprot:15454252-Alexandrium_andersonii.AAC.1
MGCSEQFRAASAALRGQLMDALGHFRGSPKGARKSPATPESGRRRAELLQAAAGNSGSARCRVVLPLGRMCDWAP